MHGLYLKNLKVKVFLSEISLAKPFFDKEMRNTTLNALCTRYLSMFNFNFKFNSQNIDIEKIVVFP
jgi:hypothetical protein